MRAQEAGEALSTAEDEMHQLPPSQVGAPPPVPGVTASDLQIASHQSSPLLSVAVASKVVSEPTLVGEVPEEAGFSACCSKRWSSVAHSYRSVRGISLNVIFKKIAQTSHYR